MGYNFTYYTIQYMDKVFQPLLNTMKIANI